MRFENRNVVIALSGSDAGIACCKNYLKEGAKVAVFYDEEERALKLKACEDGNDPEKLSLIKIENFSDPEELIRKGEELSKKWEKIDIAVAAINMKDNDKLLDMSEEEYQAILSKISTGTLFFLQPLLSKPFMLDMRKAVTTKTV